MRHWFIWGLIALLLFAGSVYLFLAYTTASPILACLLAINVTSFLVYGLDKRLGESEGPSRAPNDFLVLLALIGGAVGAVAGVYVWGHKTGPKYHRWRMALWLILLGQCLLALLWSSGSPA